MANIIKISALNRLTMTFDQEISLDKHGIFGEKYFERCRKTRDALENKRDRLLRALLRVDIVIIFLILGQDWVIPKINIMISEIPAVLHISVLYSSIVFLLGCATFVNWLCYDNICDQLGIRVGRSTGIDPDFINASTKEFVFSMKLFRRKMCIWHDDFYIPPRNYIIISYFIMTVLMLSFIFFPIVHLITLARAAYFILDSNDYFYISIFIISLVTINTIVALLLITVMISDFNFTINHPPELEEQ